MNFSAIWSLNCLGVAEPNAKRYTFMQPIFEHEKNFDTYG